MLGAVLFAFLLETMVAARLRHKYVSVDVGDAVCDVLDFGAKGDGRSDDTRAIQAAMDRCGAQGGGRVVLTAPRTYLVFSISFSAGHTELHIPEGSTLLASNDIEGWMNGTLGSAIIVGRPGKNGMLQHIAITGRGTVDGQGLVWWKAMMEPGQKDLFRPHTVDFLDVNTAIISDVSFINGPNHILELACDNCELSGISVLNPPSTGRCEEDGSCSHNTDAVDVHGSPFYVHDVNFTTGDDNIAGHANHTLVEDSYFGSGHGASIGSLCNSYVTNFTVRNCTFHGTTAGARIKSHPGCGGHVWDVHYRDLEMHDVPTTIQVNQFYFATEQPPPSTMRFERIFFDSITSFEGGGGSNGSGGDTDAVINFNCDTHYNGVNNCDVSLNNVRHFDLKNPKAGMYCRGVHGSASGVVGVSSCLKPELQQSREALVVM